MKQYLHYLLALILIGTFYSCDDDEKTVTLKTITVQLIYPDDAVFTASSGVTVTATSSTSEFTEETDESGKVTFSIPIGIYEISATDDGHSDGGKSYFYNGLKSNVTVTSDTDESEIIEIELTESSGSQIVIKEVFVGGTPTDDGSGVFYYDRYIILYNNSDESAALGNLCLATIAPYNAQASNAYYNDAGALSYESEGWIPAAQAIWYFQEDVTIEPYAQIVIATANAVDNTVTYSHSINFDNAEYYCTYDIEKFSHTSTYVSPAASIPTSHYLKAETYGAGTAWSLSSSSPGLFIFDTGDTSPSAFAADASLTDVVGAYTSQMVSTDWVVDGVEGYLLNNANNKKRFTASIDAGYVYHLNSQGYSIYRNVDQKATEALEENAGKLVYNYSLGTEDIDEGSTDSSGIDAEASIANGAHIVYQDTNNSSNDFHLRQTASLRN